MRKTIASVHKVGKDKVHSSKNESVPNSSDFYMGLFDCIGSPILIIDPQTAAILDANTAACTFYGYSHSEFIQKKILDLAVLPVEEAWRRIQKIAASEITHMTLQHRLASGEVRDVEVDLGLGNFEGRVVNIATVHDITEWKQAKKKLQESEDQYHSLFENMSEGFALQEIIQDESGHVVDFRILDANPAYESHTGQRLEDVIGHTIRETMPNADPAMIERYGQVALTGEPLDFEYYSKTFNRHIRVRSFRPRPNQFASIFEDITKRKRAEQDLRESETRLSAIFHSSHDAISIARLSDNVYLDVNEAFCNIFGITREQAIGHTGQELNIAAAPAQREEFIRRIRIQSRVANFESEFHNHAGQTGFLLISGQIVKISGQDCLVIFGKDITLRKKAEAALQAAHNELEVRVQERTAELSESEARFRSLFENSAVTTLLIEPDSGKIINANSAAVNFYGYSYEQLCSMNINEINLLFPDEVMQEMEKARSGRRNYFVFRHRLANGEVRIVEVHSNPIVIDEATLLFSFIFDVTEKMRSEKKLHESQFRTEMAVRGANTGTWEWNIQTGETIFNERWAKIVGYTLKELEPISIQTWINLCHPDDLKISDDQLQKHFSSEAEFYDCEVRMKHKDGSWIWVSDRGKVMDWTADGKPLHMFGTHLDTTERKHLENELRESEERYTTLFMKSAVPTILIKIPEFTVQDQNEACEKAFGYTKQDVFHKTGLEFGASTLPDRSTMIKEFERKGSLETIEFKVFKKSGEVATVVANIVRQTIDNKPHAIISLLDITERKLAEARLIEANASLAKALQTKDSFMAAMSHELRTPLAGILGMSEMLKMTDTNRLLTEKQLKYITSIESNGQRLLRMINNVLEFTQLQSSFSKFNMAPCILDITCSTALQKIAMEAGAKKQVAFYSANPDGMQIITDEKRLSKALTLLLENASKFTNQDGQFGIQVTSREDTRSVDITVWDTGIGISEDNLPHLFQPFTQLDARLAREYEGMGLGLAMVKGIVELLGGTVAVQSKLGEGSRFTINLPRN